MFTSLRLFVLVGVLRVIIKVIIRVHQLVTVMASFILNLELRPAEFILGIFVLQFGHRLAEVHVNTSIIDQDVVHLEIGVFAVLRLRAGE